MTAACAAAGRGKPKAGCQRRGAGCSEILPSGDALPCCHCLLLQWFSALCTSIRPMRTCPVSPKLKLSVTASRPKLAQQLLLIVEEFDAERVARAGKADRHFAFHGAGMRGHDHHTIGEIDGLGYVVGHVHHRFARLAPHVREQPLHVVAGERIERRERLVHQQHRGIVGERAGDGDPLLHAAGEMVRVGVGELLELDQLELLQRDLLALGSRHALHLQAEGNVASAPCARGRAARSPGTRCRGPCRGL